MCAQNLRHYDQSLPLILSCDASACGISAVLSNRSLDNIVKSLLVKS